MFNRDNALGCDDSHVVDVVFNDNCSVPLHKQLVTPLQHLMASARQAGFSLNVASGYRSFGRQQAIWDAKACGHRPVLDAQERPIHLTTLTACEQVRAILRWSALPGGSRHHWGCDIDIYEASALPNGQSLALTTIEANTLFIDFYDWLEDHLAYQEDFFRPYYGNNKGAVANEPWHLSYKPLAQKYEKLCDYQAFRQQLINANIQLIDAVLEQLPFIYEHYVAAYFTA
ncbi:M15 family metallopeptidase [Marinagarivorans algicola]|uniref:M15 family metallopeptidase n=1 Tax=Marinagarivorans algicola TaxID=1513270 RepID=UPI0006B49099|nr:M15 family metallopeptidase [Marinagarivorans algicola]